MVSGVSGRIRRKEEQKGETVTVSFLSSGRSRGGARGPAPPPTPLIWRSGSATAPFYDFIDSCKKIVLPHWFSLSTVVFFLFFRRILRAREKSRWKNCAVSATLRCMVRVWQARLSFDLWKFICLRLRHFGHVLLQTAGAHQTGWCRFNKHDALSVA